MLDKKLIIVKTSGPIAALNFICGPILAPWNADITTIGRLVSANCDVHEVNENDHSQTVKLTYKNYNRDNFGTGAEVEETHDDTVVPQVNRTLVDVTVDPVPADDTTPVTTEVTPNVDPVTTEVTPDTTEVAETETAVEETDADVVDTDEVDATETTADVVTKPAQGSNKKKR